MSLRLPVHVIEFVPPIAGCDGRFNTFRLGRKWSERLKKGDSVLLMDRDAGQVFARAKVERVELGRLTEMAEKYGADNHTVLAGQFPTVVDALQKIYGPQIATPNKWTTVIYLKR